MSITPGKVEELGEDAVASGHASPAGFDVVRESGSIQSLPGEILYWTRLIKTVLAINIIGCPD